MIIFINDKSIFNQRYRKNLIELVKEKKQRTLSVGILDYFGLSLLLILFLSFFPRVQLFSSNMKANIFCLCIFWKKGTVLINGLGRFKSNRTFRSLICCLINNSNKKVIFQNYSDYRYFRIYTSKKIFWVPGSGGTERSFSNHSAYLVISRDEKLVNIKDSVKAFSNYLDSSKKINIVGCEDFIVRKYFGDALISGVGYVDQKDIFKYGDELFQPAGYGEGMPHSLVDAICSSMPITMEKKDYINYGLANLGIGFSRINDKYVSLIEKTPYRSKLDIYNVNDNYLEIINLN